MVSERNSGMVKYLLSILILLSVLIPSNSPAILRGSTAGGPVTKYIGYPNTGGTPNSPVGSWVSYGSTFADRKYSRYPVTATENGTAVAINFYIQSDTVEANESWVCFFVGTTLRGWTVIPTGLGTGWHRIALANEIEYDFSTSDVLYFGVEYSSIQANAFLGRDDGASDGGIQFDTTADIASTGPPQNATSWSTSASNGIGFILEYVTR